MCSLCIHPLAVHTPTRKAESTPSPHLRGSAKPKLGITEARTSPGKLFCSCRQPPNRQSGPCLALKKLCTIWAVTTRSKQHGLPQSCNGVHQYGQALLVPCIHIHPTSAAACSDSAPPVESVASDRAARWLSQRAHRAICSLDIVICPLTQR